MCQQQKGFKNPHAWSAFSVTVDIYFFNPTAFIFFWSPFRQDLSCYDSTPALEGGHRPFYPPCDFPNHHKGYLSQSSVFLLLSQNMLVFVRDLLLASSHSCAPVLFSLARPVSYNRSLSSEGRLRSNLTFTSSRIPGLFFALQTSHRALDSYLLSTRQRLPSAVLRGTLLMARDKSTLCVACSPPPPSKMMAVGINVFNPPFQEGQPIFLVLYGPLSLCGLLDCSPRFSGLSCSTTKNIFSCLKDTLGPELVVLYFLPHP